MVLIQVFMNSTIVPELPTNSLVQLDPLKAHPICRPPVEQTRMFERVVSAVHRTIVHFVSVGVWGGEGEAERQNPRRHKRTRSAGVIGIFGSVVFRSAAVK